MSGGSYDYLCWKDPDDLLACCGAHYQLWEMAKDLTTHFPGSSAAKDTQDLAELIGHYHDEIQRRQKLLVDVWHAQEWWQSTDYVKDEVQTQIDKYEGGAK